MPISQRSPDTSGSGAKTGLRLAAAVAAAIVLAGCQPQIQTASDLLFAPTFSKSRQNIPNTHNTAYDCRTFTGTGWKGIASGQVINFEKKFMISQAGCFKTQQECKAWILHMRGYIDVPRFMRCNPYTA